MDFLAKRVEKIKSFLTILVLLNNSPCALGDCFPSPSYQATAERYSCQLRQANWASEAYFKLAYKHCRKSPTFHMFIRNFYGIDEINMEFSKAVSGWKTTKFDGETADLLIEIVTFKENVKYNYSTHIQVTVMVDSETYLLAVFPAYETSDCSWMDTLALHHKIMFGISIPLCLILLGIAIYYCKKHRPKRKSGNRPRGEVELQSIMALQTSL